MKPLAIIGRIYVVGLFTCVSLTAIYGVAAGFLSESRQDFLFFTPSGYVEGLFVAILHGLSAWGLMKHKRWGRDFSVALCFLWTAYLLMLAVVWDGDSSNWRVAIPIALVLPAMAWLLSPAAQFRLRRETA